MANSGLIGRSLAVVLLLLGTSPAWADAAIDPGGGELRALSPDGTLLGMCPLEHTDVSIEVSGFVARARVTHRFSNPFESRIEAVYVFPLPEDAAVRDMEMRVADRLVRAEIRKRAGAREDYEAARSAGKTASLLEQERPNLFTSSVANIRPGEPVSVTLEYVQTLKYDGGRYELTFPMTVGPRFIPGNPTGHSGTGYAADTDRVPDASRITPPVAPPGRSGHDIAVRVTLDAGVPMGDPISPSHELRVRRKDDRRAEIALAPHETLPNRDLILRWEVAPERVDAAVLTHRAEAEGPGYATVMLMPNASPPVADVTPKEILFVLDTSGSMYGRPMDISKGLMRKMLASLHPRDTFAVLRYSDGQSALSPAPLANTRANVQAALTFVDGLEGEGGTDALGGVRAAFAYPHDPSRLRIVVFMTDGYIGNEAEILGEIRSRIEQARLFSVGIGSSVNRYLLEEMGILGRAACRIVTPREKPDEAVATLMARMASPYLTDVSVDFGALPVTDVLPALIPDLFAGQPLMVHARYRGPAQGTVTVRGKLGGKPYTKKLDVRLPARAAENAAIGSVWARAKIKDLSREMYREERPDLVAKVTDLALAHRLMSKYTSFLAVEHRVVPDEGGGPPRLVPVPVELPEAVSPERLFPSGASLSLARFQPGDPELRVEAPSDARAVTAIFPFGETKALSFEPRLGQWTTRFLVPRRTPEGNYFINILITHKDGRQERITEGYTVDASGPEVEVHVEGTVRPGAEVRVVAEQRFTSADRRLHGAHRKVEILSDVARLRVLTADGARVPLELVTPGRWEGVWRVPEGLEPGETTLRVTAYDVAGNQGTDRVQLTVEE